MERSATRVPPTRATWTIAWTILTLEATFAKDGFRILWVPLDKGYLLLGGQAGAMYTAQIAQKPGTKRMQHRGFTIGQVLATEAVPPDPILDLDDYPLQFTYNPIRLVALFSNGRLHWEPGLGKLEYHPVAD